MEVRRLLHGRVELALHALREGPGPRLLVLHELGGSAGAVDPATYVDWPGSVHGLDFTGHGSSARPVGGGYTAEVLMADADAALAALGEATVLGFGLGAWIALLLAGVRGDRVWGSVLCDGRGLAGGGPRGASTDPIVPDRGRQGSPDPYALHELSRDARPPRYARLFAEQAVELGSVPEPVSVAARERPPWLAEALEVPGVVVRDAPAALQAYASHVPDPCLGAP